MHTHTHTHTHTLLLFAPLAFLGLLFLAHCYEIFINIVPGVRFDHLSGAKLIWLSILNFICPFSSLRHQANTPVPDLPFPLHGTSPGAPSTPSLLILCMLILS